MIAAERERLGGTAETGYTLGIIGAARHNVTRGESSHLIQFRRQSD